MPIDAAGPVAGTMNPIVRVLPHLTSAAPAACGERVLAPPVPAAAKANAATSRAKSDLFIQIPPSWLRPSRRISAALVCLNCALSPRQGANLAPSDRRYNGHGAGIGGIVS